MGVPLDLKYKFEELTRQRQADGEKPCIGCDGYGVLGFYVNGERKGFSTCGRCEGSGSEPKPDDLPPYICEECEAKEVKLWREYQTFLEHQHLLCASCASKQEGEEYTGISDQIGWMVPAVPTDTGSFWGYTSIPQDKVDWWHDLPISAESS